MSSGTTETEKHGFFEWIVSYEDLAPFLTPEILGQNHETAKILHVGCGTSRLTIDLYDDGFTNICNVDNNEAIIEYMLKEFADERSKMSWKVGQLGEDNCQSSFNGFAPVVPSVTTISDPHSDISFATPVDPPVSSIPCFLDEYKNPDYEPSRQFSFDQGGYNVIIDKSTFDCLLCSENSSNYICDIMGLLSGDGVYFLISFHPPGFIMPLFEAPELDLEINFYYLHQTNAAATEENSTTDNDHDDYKNASKTLYIIKRLNKGANHHEASFALAEHVDERRAIHEHFENHLENWFLNESPLLTELRKNSILLSFEKLIAQVNTSSQIGRNYLGDEHNYNSEIVSLCIESWYSLLFSPIEKEHLPFELFLEDYFEYSKLRNNANEKNNLVIEDGDRNRNSTTNYSKINDGNGNLTSDWNQHNGNQNHSKIYICGCSYLVSHEHVLHGYKSGCNHSIYYSNMNYRRLSFTATEALSFLEEMQ